MSGAPNLFVSDRPHGHAPAFNFAPIIRTMREFIASAPIDAPLNICVSGGWGTGKTTLLKGLESSFTSNVVSDPEGAATKYVTIWFDPWKLASEEEVRNALARAVLEVIENDASFSTRAEIGIERRNVLRMLSERLLKVSPDDVSTLYKADARTRDTFVEVEEIFYRVADVYLRDPDQPRRLVIFVDDLDRCRPARITEVLESIKLFFDLPGLIFVFALDSHQLVKAVEVDYSMTESEAREYLEKIFQLTVPLPRKRTDDLRAFLDSNLKEIGVELQNAELSSAIVERFGRNLRNLKLFINWFSFQRQLIGEIGRLDEEALFRWLYLDSTMELSMTASLKDGSPSLVLALEALAHGGFLHDEDLRNRYLKQLNASRRNYLALIAYANVSQYDDIEMPATSLDVEQQAMVDALQSDGEIIPTLKVLREGNKLFIDGDLRQMIYQTRSENVDVVVAGVPGDEDNAKSSEGMARRNLLSAQEWNRLGDRLLSAQRLVDAYLCYLLAALMDQSEAAYICDVARIFGRTNQLDAAKDLLARAFEMEPTSPYVLGEAAAFYDILLRDEELGSLLYRKALVQDTSNPSTPHYLAINLHKEGKHRQAYLACLDAYIKDPDDAAKKNLLSRCSRAAGVEDPAQRTLDDLTAELLAARAEGAYPFPLNEKEEQVLRERLAIRPDPGAVASQLSRPPF